MSAAALAAVLVMAGASCFTPATSFAGQAADRTPAVVLVTEYADGRTVRAVVGGAPRQSWTPMFPRTPSARDSAERLPVRALKYRQVLTENGAVQVDLSVLRGDGHEKEEAVATVLVRRGDRVTIDALRGFGVRPVTLSLTPLLPSTLSQPNVLNRTAGLEVVDIAATDEPGARYRISVKNVSSRPAVNFHFIAHHRGRPALSGNRGHLDSTPLIEPGAVYAFTLEAGREVQGTSGEVVLASHDFIEIAAVLWEDGEVEGDPAPMASALAIYRARAAQLTHGVRILKSSAANNGASSREWLRAQLEAMPTVPDAALVAAVGERLRHFEPVNASQQAATLQAILASVRRGMIDDLDAAPRDRVAFEAWLRDIVVVYERQARRFEQR